MDDLEELIAEIDAEMKAKRAALSETQAREARIADKANLMWLVVGALYNAVRDNDGARIVAGSPTDQVICEIVNYVEGRA